MTQRDLALEAYTEYILVHSSDFKMQKDLCNEQNDKKRDMTSTAKSRKNEQLDKTIIFGNKKL